MNLMQSLVISNLFGLGFVALSWVAVILIYEAEKGGISWPLPWLLGSLLLVGLDVGYRRIRSNRTRRADQTAGLHRHSTAIGLRRPPAHHSSSFPCG